MVKDFEAKKVAGYSPVKLGEVMSFRHFTPSGQVNPGNRSDADRIKKLTFEHSAFVKRPKATPEPSRFRSIMPVPQDTYSSGNIMGFMPPWLRVIPLPNRALSVFSAPFKQVRDLGRADVLLGSAQFANRAWCLSTIKTLRARWTGR